MKHQTTNRFWDLYSALPDEIRKLADKSFALLKINPGHPSLRFKKVGKFWPVRIGIAHRALAVQDGEDFTRVRIGLHNEYDRLIYTPQFRVCQVSET